MNETWQRECDKLRCSASSEESTDSGYWLRGGIRGFNGNEDECVDSETRENCETINFHTLQTSQAAKVVHNAGHKSSRYTGDCDHS